jgi:alpha-L-fucosidase
MKQEHLISGFTYLPARGGFIESFEVEVSADGQNWKRIHHGTFGNIINDPSRRVVLFDNPVSARYVKLSGLTAPGSNTHLGAGELQILSGK